MDVYTRMNEKGIVLPKAPAKGGLYTPAREFGEKFIYISGCGPVLDMPITGKLGADFDVEQGMKYAGNCVLNLLAVLKDKVGNLNRVRNVVKILVFVSSSNDFYAQPQVANGASQKLMDVFGEEIGCPSRSAIGVNVLPGNIPVEVEALFEIQ